MKKLMLLGLVLSVVIIAGCTQPTPAPLNNTTTISQYKKLTSSDLQISNTEYPLDNFANMRTSDGKCVADHEKMIGFGAVYVRCEKTLGCNMYTNGKLDTSELKLCDVNSRRFLVAEKNFTNEYGNNVEYTYLDEDKTIMVCCSYVDNNGNYLKDYEICQSAILNAFCTH